MGVDKVMPRDLGFVRITAGGVLSQPTGGKIDRAWVEHAAAGVETPWEEGSPSARPK